MSLDIAKCPLRVEAELLPVENHCSKAIVITYWICDYFQSFKISWPIIVCGIHFINTFLVTLLAPGIMIVLLLTSGMSG